MKHSGICPKCKSREIGVFPDHVAPVFKATAIHMEKVLRCIDRIRVLLPKSLDSFRGEPIESSEQFLRLATENRSLDEFLSRLPARVRRKLSHEDYDKIAVELDELVDDARKHARQLAIVEVHICGQCGFLERYVSDVNVLKQPEVSEQHNITWRERPDGVYR